MQDLAVKKARVERAVDWVMGVPRGGLAECEIGPQELYGTCMLKLVLTNPEGEKSES
ncbi:MAG: hypothetical protein LBE61_00255 [Burkholderiaceae bacterium]|jgi:hypothetical protein|nr:hypothetical protein [Burkholderiaceae bacterium]